MIDRFVNQTLNQPQESFYFQLIPITLTLVNKHSELPAQGATYRFSVLKGTQKFDQNRAPIAAEFTKVKGCHIMEISSCRLNFYLPSAPKGRKIEFTLRAVQRQKNVDYPLGDYSIDANALISSFRVDNTTRYELKSNFSDDYELEFQIYVDNNRVTLEKNIRSYRQDRAIKSPLRNIKEESSVHSTRKTLNQPEKKQEVPQRDNKIRQDQAEPQPQRPKKASLIQRKGGRQESAEVGSVASKKSKDLVPLVQTKFKALSKTNASEIKRTDSQRLGVIAEPVVVVQKGESGGERFFMMMFLLFGLLTTYWAMNPSRKV